MRGEALNVETVPSISLIFLPAKARRSFVSISGSPTWFSMGSTYLPLSTGRQSGGRGPEGAVSGPQSGSDLITFALWKGQRGCRREGVRRGRDGGWQEVAGESGVHGGWRSWSHTFARGESCVLCQPFQQELGTAQLVFSNAP